jgi:hypothetical protein
MPRTKPRRVGTAGNVRVSDVPRHAIPLPRERVADVAFVFDPDGRGGGQVIAPWPRHVLWPDEEARLCAVLDQIGEYGAALRKPVWVWPDGRSPVPVQAPEPRSWVSRWAADRATYVRR